MLRTLRRRRGLLVAAGAVALGMLALAAIAFYFVTGPDPSEQYGPPHARRYIAAIRVQGFERRNWYRDGVSSNAVYVGQYPGDNIAQQISGPGLQLKPPPPEWPEPGPLGTYIAIGTGREGNTSCKIFVSKAKSFGESQNEVELYGLTNEQEASFSRGELTVLIVGVLCEGEN